MKVRKYLSSIYIIVRENPRLKIDRMRLEDSLVISVIPTTYVKESTGRWKLSDVLILPEFWFDCSDSWHLIYDLNP